MYKVVVSMRLLAFVFLMMWSVVAFAETELTESEHEFTGKIEFGGDKKSGNTNTSNYEGAVELGYTYGPWETQFAFSGNQATEDGVLSEDYYEGSLKGLYNFQNNYYAFLLYTYRKDIFSGIYWEKGTIGGLGYHAFTDIPDYSLDVELGFGERNTKKTTKITIDNDPGMHLAIAGSYNVSERDTVSTKITLENGNDDDYVQKNFSWEHKLNESLRLGYAYEARTVTLPEVGKARTDVHTNFYLGYEF